MVEELRDRIAYLERQVEEEREARRRADTILAQLSAATAEQARTIRAIEGPSETPGTRRRSKRSQTSQPPRSDAPGSQTAAQRPWWRRWIRDKDSLGR
jgi:hypothetical protein